MSKYKLLFTVTGWSKGVVEADSEEEAREKVDRGAWGSRGGGDNLTYDLEKIERDDSV